MPIAKSGHRRNRALTTITFFRLDDPIKRKNLALIIMALFPLLQSAANGDASAQSSVKGFLSARLVHLNCAKSFKRLFNSNAAEAKAVYEASIALVTSSS